MKTFLLFALPPIILTTLYYFFRTKIFTKETNKGNEVVGIYFGFVGLIYSLVLAFVVIAVWEDYQQTKENINKEATAIATLYSYANLLPEEHKINLKKNLRTYTSLIIEDEWKKLEEGSSSSKVDHQLLMLRATIFKIQDTSIHLGYNNIVNSLIDDYMMLRNLRIERIEDNHSSLPNIVWVILIAGSLICVFFLMIVYLEDIAKQMSLIFITTFMFNMILNLTLILDVPFQNPSKLEPEAFRTLFEKQFLLADQ